MTRHDWFRTAKRYALVAQDSPYRRDWLRYALHALRRALEAA